MEYIANTEMLLISILEEAAQSFVSLDVITMNFENSILFETSFIAK